MASVVRSLRFTTRASQCRAVTQSCSASPVWRQRPFSTTSTQWKSEKAADGTEADSIKSQKASAPAPANSPVVKQKPLSPTKSAETPQEIADFQKKMTESFEMRSKLQIDEFIASGAMGLDETLDIADEEDTKVVRSKKFKESFMNMGEEEPFEDEEADEVDEDDIGTLGHMELEHHREMRHYARLAAWEMPLLAKLAKPFEPPTKSQPLRFRYTSYMGEQHPAEKKVVCEFCVADMPNTTRQQRNKLRKLAGVRYNPETDIIKISSEMYATQAQNKRYLGTLVDKLLTEARDPTDTFADIPLDTRHHVVKTKPKFPKEWRMSPERRGEIEAHRQSMLQKDKQMSLEGSLVDGVKQIEDILAARAAEAASMPEVVIPVKGAKGKAQKVSLRR
ncbi:hypothetical protein BP6252_12420 [Coleophoma cylindrospora]|uniref:Small ribosomal subunit protein mS35 mitochondrial conserved domain-containing protein n=1 Tax=Coleophoma cylindrospora TaxID=1849047 RepID=A0A3D8QH20_9HELO|nr:hypothetical protein BP6252_12420 [Coleophoma cylindrospora]